MIILEVYILVPQTELLKEDFIPALWQQVVEPSVGHCPSQSGCFRATQLHHHRAKNREPDFRHQKCFKKAS